MRKAAIILITALLVSAAAGTYLVRLGKANPYRLITIPPPVGMEPPIIELNSPQENVNTDSNKMLLNYQAKTGNSTSSYERTRFAVNYEADWLNTVDPRKTIVQDTDNDGSIEISLLLTNIPDGNRSITVYAWEEGRITIPANGYVGLIEDFYVISNKTATFYVDTVLPTVTVLELGNMTVAEHAVPLNFTVDEPAAKIAYVLDGQDNVTVAGNSTLTGLPVGEHNVIVYAWDAAGNIGASETVTFTVAEPEGFPTVPVAAVSAASVAALAAAGLIFTRRKRRKEAPQE